MLLVTKYTIQYICMYYMHIYTYSAYVGEPLCTRTEPGLELKRADK